MAIDPEASTKLQPELLAGESVLWSGKPNPGVIFHSDDWKLIPFSLLWGGFAIFWEAFALGFLGSGSRSEPPTFMALFGIPFVLMGQYFIWGRFLYDGWLKRRTWYAVTDRRVLVRQEGWNNKTGFIYIDVIPTIVREGSQTGTLWFESRSPVLAGRGQRTSNMSRFSFADTPVLADIDDVDSVYRTILELRERSRKTSPLS